MRLMVCLTNGTYTKLLPKISTHLFALHGYAVAIRS